MNVQSKIYTMAGVVIGAVIIQAFLTAGNFTGIVKTITDLFPFILAGAGALYVMKLG